MWSVVCSLTLVTLCVAAPAVSWTYFDHDFAAARLQLDIYDYEDKCVELAKAEWAWLLEGARPSGDAEKRKMQEEVDMAAMKRNIAWSLHNEWSRDIHQVVHMDLDEGFDLISHPGDALLSSQQYLKKLNYTHRVAARYGSEKIPCYRNASDGCWMDVNVVKHVLAKSGDPNELLHTWRLWNEAVKPEADTFYEQLQLVKEAAKANEEDDPETYWLRMQEMDASLFEDGYSRAEEMWQDIKPLYVKLHKYVARKLRHNLGNFGTNGTNIPAYLLGSFMGEDWSNLADLVSPAGSSVYSEIQNNIAKKGWRARDLYNLANNTIKRLGLKVRKIHSTDIVFNGTCPPKTVFFCKTDIVRVSTCSAVDWIQFLNAHEVVSKVTHLPLSNDEKILKHSNRDSANLDVVSGLVMLLAASPSNLQHLHLLHSDNLDEEEYTPNKELLLLIALRVLPRLPFYLAADKWRLHMLANNVTDTSSWRRYREQYQMIEAPAGTRDVSFLSDPYITSNRPYLVKFMATILQFQLYHYFVSDGSTNPIQEVKDMDELEHLMMKYSKKWPELIHSVLSMNEIRTEGILNYFQPLEEFLDDEQEDTTKVVREHVPMLMPQVIDIAEDPFEDEFEDVQDFTSEMPENSTEIETINNNIITNTVATNISTVIQANVSSGVSDIGKASPETNTVILFASLVVFGLALTAGIFMAGRHCYKRKYQRNRRPPSERLQASRAK